MNKIFEAPREAGLTRLESFVPQASSVYQTRRNYDVGSESKVSGLSPYLSHRLITESEVVQAVLEQHTAKQIEAFLEEVCWRTYWKGWLEGRPQMYSAWCRLLSEDSRRWPQRDDYLSAIAGKTGIEAFDSWVLELTETGYLHNHARMWFASIWIFTLKLPWSLGAAFFMKHLLDGDVASNTLSWRWVAGLHTKGKHYLATAANIKKYTEGRFFPDKQLVENAGPLTGPANLPYISPIDYPFATSTQLGEDYALLLTGDDLSPEIGVTGELRPKMVLSLRAQDLNTDWDYDEKVLDFKSQAILDAQTRAQAHFSCPVSSLEAGQDPAGSLQAAMSEANLSSLVYYEPFVGPWKNLTAKLSARDVGVKFFPLRRPWDGLLHPHAVKGYFHFKKHVLPQVIRSKGKI